MRPAAETYAPRLSVGAGGTVTLSPQTAKEGDTVALAVKPETGQRVKTVAVTANDGTAVAVQKAAEGRYTFTMPKGGVTVTVTFETIPAPTPKVFADLSPTAYYYDAVAWAIEMGIAQGVNETTFAPASPCTRAQILTFLYRASTR